MRTQLQHVPSGFICTPYLPSAPSDLAERTLGTMAITYQTADANPIALADARQQRAKVDAGGQ